MLALVGVVEVVRAPAILAALNPLAALGFLTRHGWLAFVSLGSVALALTGAEALYADMGHFGPTPIRLSWFGLVFPSLGLNYLGQGALLLTDPKAVDKLFLHLFPSWALYPMIVLATVATVIASQAVISGAFSMTKQAIQLGFLPRMNVIHTSDREWPDPSFQRSTGCCSPRWSPQSWALGPPPHLVLAYGIAVTGTMLITTRFFL